MFGVGVMVTKGPAIVGRRNGRILIVTPVGVCLESHVKTACLPSWDDVKLISDCEVAIKGPLPPGPGIAAPAGGQERARGGQPRSSTQLVAEGASAACSDGH